MRTILALTALLALAACDMQDPLGDTFRNTTTQHGRF